MEHLSRGEPDDIGHPVPIDQTGSDDDIRVRDVDEALRVANGTAYGLSAGVCTRDLSAALRCVRELRCGTVNIREVPGYRTELTPFGGRGDSGLGVKEGVIEAMRAMTFTKLYTLPWE